MVFLFIFWEEIAVFELKTYCSYCIVVDGSVWISMSGCTKIESTPNLENDWRTSRMSNARQVLKFFPKLYSIKTSITFEVF